MGLRSMSTAHPPTLGTLLAVNQTVSTPQCILVRYYYRLFYSKWDYYLQNQYHAVVETLSLKQLRPRTPRENVN